MPKTKDNPIKIGAKSKIYLLAYPEPITGYSIAKRMQPQHTHPSTARVYTNLKAMKADGLIEIVDEKNQSNVEPLLKAIVEELELNNYAASDDDLEKLRSFLNGFFRDMVKKTVKKMDMTEDISAYHILTEALGDYARTCMINNRMKDKDGEKYRKLVHSLFNKENLFTVMLELSGSVQNEYYIPPSLLKVLSGFGINHILDYMLALSFLDSLILDEMKRMK